MKIKIIIVIIAATTLTSCAYIFNGLVFPHQCKKCEVIDKFTNTSVWSDEGCGSGITNVEENAKVQAYDLNQGSFENRYEVRCTTWTDTAK
jgi:hypothetical protein